MLIFLYDQIKCAPDGVVSIALIKINIRFVLVSHFCSEIIATFAD